jgi:molecular chaperone GrpE
VKNETQGHEAAPANADATVADHETAAAQSHDDERLAARLAQVEADLANTKDQLLRALAETENVRRRAEREREDAAKYGIAKFSKDLLAVADNLRRALEAITPDDRERDPAISNLLAGVEATERQLLSAFERNGIQRMEPLDKPADPNWHQIMMEMEGTGKQPGIVAQVLQAGYTLHGRLLREAIVGVAKGGVAPHVNTSA